MDKVAKLFQAKLKIISGDYRNKILKLPLWKLDSFLPEEIKVKKHEEKVDYLMRNYKTNNPLYLLLNNDLKLLKENNYSFDEFNSINIDPRYLESLGYNETQIDIYYEFVNKVKALI